MLHYNLKQKDCCLVSYSFKLVSSVFYACRQIKVPQLWNVLFLCGSGVLLIAEVVSRFEKIGSFVRKLHKLGFGLENKVEYE